MLTGNHRFRSHRGWCRGKLSISYCSMRSKRGLANARPTGAAVSGGLEDHPCLECVQGPTEPVDRPSSDAVAAPPTIGVVRRVYPNVPPDWRPFVRDRKSTRL